MPEPSEAPGDPPSARPDPVKILVIEDDDLVRRVIADALAAAGYAAIATGDGRRGLASFRRERPALVITDILMPEQEGIETILEIRKLAPQVKIIAISGGHRDFLEMAEKLGASAVLAKPFRPAQLLAAVSRLLVE